MAGLLTGKPFGVGGRFLLYLNSTLLCRAQGSISDHISLSHRRIYGLTCIMGHGCEYFGVKIRQIKMQGRLCTVIFTEDCEDNSKNSTTRTCLKAGVEVGGVKSSQGCSVIS